MFFRLISYIFIVGSLFAYFFYEYYIAELAISFLPYRVLASGIMFVFWLLYSLLSWHKLGRNRCHIFLRIEKIIFVLSGLLLFILYFTPIKQFYYNQNAIESGKYQIQENDVSILFANLLWTNIEYSGIQKLISENNPDILMFVEFSDNHYEYLHNYLEENYPYINRTTWSKELMVGSMVFSKYPINNIVEDFDQGAWRYGYFELLFNSESYYFYLLHTSSPVSLSFWRMRNKQLTTFLYDFFIHKEFRKHDNVVIVGDFNLSPWSYYYKDFVDTINDANTNIIRNVSNTQGLIFSWLGPKFLSFMSFLQVHIDHIFTSKEDLLFFDKLIYVSGSDHKALLFYIKGMKK